MNKSSRRGSVFVWLFLSLLCFSQIVYASDERSDDKALLTEIQALRSDLKNYFVLGIGAQRQLDAISKLETQLSEIENEIISREIDLKTNMKEKETLDKDLPDYDNRVKDYDLFSYKSKIIIDSFTEKGFDIKNKINKHQGEIDKLLEKQ